MQHTFARNTRHGLLGATLTAALMTNSAVALADDSASLASPQPFEAQYRLEIRGWPSANITHTLTHEGSHWLSDMSFSIAVARGNERSRFYIDDGDTHSLLYNSSYSLFGVGDSYQLNQDDIPSIDRQAALFDLSRRAGTEGCTESNPCDIDFVDHRGRDEHFHTS